MELICLVCPRCHETLTAADGNGWRCSACDALYPRRAEVDVFLTDDEWHACRAHQLAEQPILERYETARRTVPVMIAYYDWWVSRLLAEIPDTARGPLVELMCGGAEVCRRLPSRFAAAFALDLNVASVERAARELRENGDRRVRLVCGTAAHVPLPDTCTDAVIIQGALHHARPQLPQILSEVARLLKPKGVFVGSEPANDHWLTRAIRHWQYRHSHMQGNDPDEDGFSREDLAAVFRQAGLRLDRYEQFGFVAYPLMGNADMVPWLAAPRWLWLRRPLMALDALLERVPLVRRLAWASLFRAVKD
jgi:SAM-dependent methyltransferase